MFEGYFMPYCSGSAVRGKNIVILAPHPDDEVFGCGASASKWLDQGCDVQVCILTSGVLRNKGESRSSHEEVSFKEAAERRLTESKKAANVLGMPKPKFFGRQDGELWDDYEIEELLFNYLEKKEVETLVIPSVWEMHRDHRATAEIGIRLAQRLTSIQQVAFYEVGVPLTPNVIEDVSGYQEKKWQAMQCFVSQLTEQDYAEQIQGLNRFRSYTLGKSVCYAEAFYCLPVIELPAFMQQHQSDYVTLSLREAEQQDVYKQNIIQQQELRIQYLEELLQQTYQTLSWRMTKPIRWLKMILNRK